MLSVSIRDPAVLVTVRILHYRCVTVLFSAVALAWTKPDKNIQQPYKHNVVTLHLLEVLNMGMRLGYTDIGMRVAELTL